MRLINLEFIKIKKGSDLLSHINAVPSALLVLTSLFGMERGDPQCYNHLKVLIRIHNYNKMNLN